MIRCNLIWISEPNEEPLDLQTACWRQESRELLTSNNARYFRDHWKIRAPGAQQQSLATKQTEKQPMDATTT